MRILTAVIGLIMTVVASMAAPVPARACDRDGEKVTPATDQLEGKVAALLTAQVARPSEPATSLGVTLFVRSESRLVTVIVLDSASIIGPEGTAISAEDIPPDATVLVTGRWQHDELFEATRIELIDV